MISYHCLAFSVCLVSIIFITCYFYFYCCYLMFIFKVIFIGFLASLHISFIQTSSYWIWICFAGNIDVMHRKQFSRVCCYLSSLASYRWLFWLIHSVIATWLIRTPARVYEINDRRKQSMTLVVFLLIKKIYVTVYPSLSIYLSLSLFPSLSRPPSLLPFSPFSFLSLTLLRRVFNIVSLVRTFTVTLPRRSQSANFLPNFLSSRSLPRLRLCLDSASIASRLCLNSSLFPSARSGRM